MLRESVSILCCSLLKQVFSVTINFMKLFCFFNFSKKAYKKHFYCRHFLLGRRDTADIIKIQKNNDVFFYAFLHVIVIKIFNDNWIWFQIFFFRRMWKGEKEWKFPLLQELQEPDLNKKESYRICFLPRKKYRNIHRINQIIKKT